MKSYLANMIVREYKKETKFKKNKQKTELTNFIIHNCKNCKNKKENCCNITRNTDGNLQCVFKS